MMIWCEDEGLIQFTVTSCVGGDPRPVPDSLQLSQTQSDSVRLSPALNPSDTDQINTSRGSLKIISTNTQQVVSLMELTETKQCEQNILTRDVWTES